MMNIRYLAIIFRNVFFKDFYVRQEMENEINFARSFFDLNYFPKIAVITFMNREMIHLLATYENLNDAQIKSMSIQELFDLRHEMLALRDKLGVLLRE